MFGAFNTFGKLGSPAGSRSLLAQIQSMGASFIGIPSLSNYQDSAGTTLVTQPGGGAADPPVGLALDLSQGVALGPELVTNGDFNTDTSWAKHADWTISGGSANLVIGAGYGIISQNYTYSVGKTYKVVVVVSAVAGADVMFLPRLGRQIGPHITAAGTYVFYFQAIAGDLYFGIQDQADTGTASIDSISVRELKGNHATQSTSTARPKLSARVNLLTYTEDFSNAVWLTNGKIAKGASVTDPLGGNKAITVTATAANGDIYSNIPSALGASFTNSVWIRRRSGSGEINLSSPNNVGYAVSVTSEWTRFAAPPSSSTSSGSGPSYLVIRITTAGDAVDIAFPQMETDSTASRYQRVTDANTYDYAGFPLIHQFDAVDDAHVITFASSLGSDCTVVTANRGTTPTIATAQTIGTSYTISATHAGKLIFPRALTAGETAVVTAWATKQGAIS